MAERQYGNNSSGASNLGGGTSGQYGPLSGQTYYATPDIAQQLIQALSGAPGAAAGQFNQFIQNPTASPLFQNQLQGLLQALAPSEQQAQQQLSDQFRGAGNMASTAYGQAGAKLQGDILGRRQQVAGDLLGKSFGQITQALLGAMQQGPQLLESMRLSQQYRAPQQQTTTGGGTSSQQQTASRTTQPSGGGSSGYLGGLDQQIGGYSPLNPGQTPYDQAYFSQYGELPSANPFNTPGYQDPYANMGATYFGPGGQMVGGATQGNQDIYSQIQDQFNPQPYSGTLEGDTYESEY